MNEMKDNVHWNGLGADNMLALRPVEACGQLVQQPRKPRVLLGL